MSALLNNGLGVTALHNLFIFDSPRIFYMHVHGHGKATDLARMAKPAIDLIGNGSPSQKSTVTGGRTNGCGKDCANRGMRRAIWLCYRITVRRDDLNIKDRERRSTLAWA
ncbi:MAG TPA: DUF1259 domain-containing protein [Bryobacteraceae bacterium]|nr:DUF1259 domain-containing protein [Bryobacteraceae bacterium]